MLFGTLSGCWNLKNNYHFSSDAWGTCHLTLTQEQGSLWIIFVKFVIKYFHSSTWEDCIARKYVCYHRLYQSCNDTILLKLSEIVLIFYGLLPLNGHVRPITKSLFSCSLMHFFFVWKLNWINIFNKNSSMYTVLSFHKLLYIENVLDLYDCTM